MEKKLKQISSDRMGDFMCVGYQWVTYDVKGELHVREFKLWVRKSSICVVSESGNSSYASLRAKHEAGEPMTSVAFGTNKSALFTSDDLSDERGLLCDLDPEQVMAILRR